mmetsp:Transcript_51495/g.154592  ORF Transcript_51495/g.154592 Transcript_51495/m.154592 type:complete len:276 (-) Transcript_51495:346-1173(-)
MTSAPSIQSCRPWLVCKFLVVLLAVESAAFAPTQRTRTSPPRRQWSPRSTCLDRHRSVIRQHRIQSPSLRSMEENAAGRAASKLTRGGGGGARIPAFVYAANSASKWVVTLAHTLAVWSRPWTYTAPYIVVGSIGAVYLTEALKRIINQGRPEGAPFADPGMPSSHSLVSFFAAAAWTSALDFTGAEAARAVIVGAAAVVALLRVVCGYHTVAQIVVGAGLGSTLGRGWALLGEAMHSGGDPRLVTALAWGSYLGGSALFIKRTMKHWVGKDKHI